MPKEHIYSAQFQPVPGAPVPDLTYAQVAWDRGGLVVLRVHPVIEQGEQLPPALDVDLGRQQINNLIRALRRARDQAYGRDE